MQKVAICGASGYTGGELLRLLQGHPEVEVSAVTSERSAGKSVSQLFPHLHNYSDLIYEPLDAERLIKRADVFFMALPHGASQEAVDFFVKRGKLVIDLSADYRLRDPEVYKEWYKTPHRFIDTLKRAVYGLPGIYRKEIQRARLIANPGCYPTGALLGLYPLIRAGLLEPEWGIVIDSKSGTSGAGRQADLAFSFCEVNEGFRAYALTTHRHTPEIEQELSLLLGAECRVDFTPHLLPLDRGILTTIYVKTKTSDIKKIRRAYENSYKEERFVRLLAEGISPNIKNVRGTNHCHVGLAYNKRTERLIIVTAIDNLVKGASGQAVQNLNIALGIDEAVGLDNPAVFP